VKKEDLRTHCGLWTDGKSLYRLKHWIDEPSAVFENKFTGGVLEGGIHSRCLRDLKPLTEEELTPALMLTLLGEHYE
jgi:hypothetical protein